MPSGPSGCLMFVPSEIASDRTHVLQLLDVTCGREDVLQTVSNGEEGDSRGYLLLVKTGGVGGGGGGGGGGSSSVENRRIVVDGPSRGSEGVVVEEEDLSWSGEVVRVEPTAATTIALSHLAVSLYLAEACLIFMHTGCDFPDFCKVISHKFMVKTKDICL